MPDEEFEQLQHYADSINIDMVPDGFRFVSRDGVPLVGLGPLELYEEPGNPQLLTRCAAWYGDEALAEWKRRSEHFR